MVLIPVIIIIVSSYLLFVLFLVCGWKRLPVWNCVDKGNLSVSVILPVRDEVENISGIVQQLENQTYPKQEFEVIIVDDHSEDGTYAKLLDLSRVSDLNIRIVQLPSDENSAFSPKKAAITAGVENAKGEIVLMTDADVELGEQWIQCHVTAFANSDTKFVSAPVMMKSEHFLEEVQSLEFASLIGTGASLLFFNTPIMCNGANLAYRKEVFHKVGGYENNRHIISGDDEFLMHKIYKLYPSKVFFMKSLEATVWVKPLNRFTDFYNQRRRWSGKWKFHANIYSSMLAVYIFIVHSVFLISVLLGIFKMIPGRMVITLWIAKIIIEYVFLLQIFQFFAKKLKIFPFIISSLLYSLYAVTFGILSNFGGYVWKGRRYKN